MKKGHHEISQKNNVVMKEFLTFGEGRGDSLARE